MLMNKPLIALLISVAALFSSTGTANARYGPPIQDGECGITQANQVESGLRCVWLHRGAGAGGYYWQVDRGPQQAAWNDPANQQHWCMTDYLTGDLVCSQDGGLTGTIMKPGAS
jgi:hypothetical protein